MIELQYFNGSNNNAKSKGDNFEKLTYAYFKLDPKYQFYGKLPLNSNGYR
jgi:hypothetical protein